MPFTSNPAEIEVSPEDTANALTDGSAQVIDVREQYEWDAGRIEGTTHIALGELGANVGRLASDTPIIFYCRVGGRSLQAAEAARASGYDAYSMAGGIELWDNQRRPLAPEDGEVA